MLRDKKLTYVTPAVKSPPMGPPDDWEIWNKERNDSVFETPEASSGRLPGELKAYSTDFDRNGKWVRVADYGDCWVPTADVGSDWLCQ